jgi:elongation factor P
MATYYSNDFRAGLKIMMDGEPYAVEASEFVNQAKARLLRALSCAVC